ncbi:MAG TPA: hypothetical protein H9687_06260 [Firmicutes bacterium]|mgnify:CR=1 FL=1|nr:hypothetical protein [Bacillota bacterium]
MSQCDTCLFYVYDEEYGDYCCDVRMDEDDAVRLFGGRRSTGCPYYRVDDEYATVRKQI